MYLNCVNLNSWLFKIYSLIICNIYTHKNALKYSLIIALFYTTRLSWPASFLLLHSFWFLFFLCVFSCKQSFNWQIGRITLLLHPIFTKKKKIIIIQFCKNSLYWYYCLSNYLVKARALKISSQILEVLRYWKKNQTCYWLYCRFFCPSGFAICIKMAWPK